MKAHKHKDVIIAWANGAKVQERRHAGIMGWYDNDDPCFSDKNHEFRIKPREFKEGGWYQVIADKEYILKYSEGRFVCGASGLRYESESFDWIGEALEIEWPDNG